MTVLIRLKAALILALFGLTVCFLGASSSGAKEGNSLAVPLAQAEATPTVVIPGMPSCCCEPGIGLETPTPSPTTVRSIVPQAGKVVAVDPGHGGRETGAVAASGLMEKDVNLRIAMKLAALLRAGGYTPVLTRDSDRVVNTAGRDLNGSGVVDNDDDLQARVDIANAAHADMLVSIHNDGSPDSSARGTKTFYCDVRPFESENIRLAQDLRSALVASIRGAGYSTRDLGAGDDAPLKKPYGHLFVLGPLTPRVARASEMPGALGETLYLTNPREASLLASDQMLAAIAQGYYDGIAAYFSGK